jgi:hypothetical protein
MAQEDCIVGFTSAAKALLATVLQSTEAPPFPEPLLLQEMLMKTDKMISDVIAKVFLMLENFLERVNYFRCKITQKV